MPLVCVVVVIGVRELRPFRVNFVVCSCFQNHFIHANKSIYLLKESRHFCLFLQTEEKKEENLADKMRNGSMFVLQNDDEHHLSNEICSSKADLTDRKGKIQEGSKHEKRNIL